MNRISFDVKGKPVPKSRPRVVTKGERRFAYTPKNVKEWENTIRDEASKHFKRPFNWPVFVCMVFYLQRPKSRSLEKWVSTYPDLDNLEKSVLDALNKVAYADDRLVVAKSSSKRYVIGGEPRVWITIKSLSDQQVLEDFD